MNEEKFLELLNNYNIYDLDLANSCNSNPFVKLVYQDEVGILDITQIFDENGIESNYFISGPPAMIKTFKNKLIGKGVPPENVLTDDWE